MVLEVTGSETTVTTSAIREPGRIYHAHKRWCQINTPQTFRTEDDSDVEGRFTTVTSVIKRLGSY